MRHLDRLLATAVIWGAFTAIMIASPASSDGFIVLVLAIAAGVSTSTMWESVGKEGSTVVASEAEAAKAKRRAGSPVARLMEVLDEDERRELYRRLAAEEDGELVDLDTLLREERR